jgi:hypothetical protein
MAWQLSIGTTLPLPISKTKEDTKISQEIRYLHIVILVAVYKIFDNVVPTTKVMDYLHDGKNVSNKNQTTTDKVALLKPT